MIRKIGFYFLSVCPLFVLTLIITVKVPDCFVTGGGLNAFVCLLSNNIIPMLSIIALLIAYFSYHYFKHIISGTPELSFKIIKIKKVGYKNPTLGVFGFKLYKLTGGFRSGKIREIRVIISRDALTKDDRVKYFKFNNHVYYGRKTDAK